MIGALRAEEANLLHVRRLALAHGWYRAIIGVMQGLRVLYDHTGRRAEWRALVAEIVPLFVNPATDGAFLGRAEQWPFVMQYRVQILQESREWAAAERVFRVVVTDFRQQATPLLDVPPEQLDANQRNTLRSLASALHTLGQIQREQDAEACVASYQESYNLALRIGEYAVAATCAFNLGHAYKDIPALRNLAKAEQWYRRSMELRAEQDRLGRGRVLGQIGYVAWERFKEARQAGQLGEVLDEHLNAAFKACQDASLMFPPDAVTERATIHNQLSIIYNDAGQIEQAVAHYRESIRYKEQAGNLYGAATTRENVAIAYANTGRIDDALLFARAALRNYKQFGPAAAAEVEQARERVAWIEGLARGGR